mmetsp:Transcript_143307/g.457965  ORF Transcript_143307/g.457965 Transcript_143307/m.457965 type:complete len:233 (+) Transcript_143307:63-761(+)
MPHARPTLAHSRRPQNNVHALVGINQVAHLIDLQAEGRSLERLRELLVPPLDPAHVACQVAGLQAALAFAQIAAALCEDFAAAVALDLLQDASKYALGLASRSSDLPVPDLVHRGLALLVLHQYVPQAHLRRLIVFSPLRRWWPRRRGRRIIGSNVKEGHDRGQPGVLPDLPQVLHRGVDESACRHARPPRAPSEDRGHGDAPADGLEECPAHEGEALMLLVKLQHSHFWSW